jgi:hypothetical protein
LLAVIAAATLGASVPAGAQAAIGIERFFAANCEVGFASCGQETIGPYTLPKEEISTVPQPPPTEEAIEEAEEQGFTQAGGRAPFGITAFMVKTEGPGLPNLVPEGIAKGEGIVTHIRTDVAPGLATSPAAVPQCTEEEFGIEVAKGIFLGPGPGCAPAKIGENKAIVYAGVDVPLKGNVYNLVQRPGLASEFGVALNIESLTGIPGTYAHTIIEGNVEWGKQPQGTGAGDFHDYFEIDVSPELPLISSILVFTGTSGNGAFITNGTRCPGHNTTTLTLNGAEGGAARTPFTTLLSLENCAAVPFNPSFSLAPASFGNDEPVGFTTEVGIPYDPVHPAPIAQSQLKTAVIQLPEGMTLNPSAAAGLQACTPKQAQINSPEFGTKCPAASKIGTVELEVPTLPGISLTGNIYLGGPESGPITGPPYVIYLDAGSTRYGVSVRLKGETTPNPTTGQLTTVFAENPEQPFTRAILNFNGGALAPIASPLECGPKSAAATLYPFTEIPLSTSVLTAFSVTGCPSVLPFTWGQTTSTVPSAGQPDSFFIFKLFRSDGQQYLSQARTVLPEGLVAKIPAVPLCPEPQANAESGCSPENQIGTATVLAGAGPQPFEFSGPVYLTGPYNGAPYGLSIKVPAVAGPFNFGTVVTRSKIEVEQYSGRVILTTNMPTIRNGVPLRVRLISVLVNRPGYLLAPTGCENRPAESTLTSTLGVKQSASNPFQAAGCDTLAFGPSFKSASFAKTSKANGAALETTVNQTIGQANIKSVLVQLPPQLPSRLTTLQKACLAATFEANPFSCPEGSRVGGARADTPTLPSKLQGPAYLVSHGGEAFPDLDLVMEANGVRVILVGHTDIKKEITTTNFSTTPDVPVSSITVNLPTGPHSALAANGNLCPNPLIMPTTITAQNGKQIKQNTKVNVRNCPVEIVGAKAQGDNAVLTVRTYEAGRVSGSGSDLDTVFRHLNSASRSASLTVPLSSAGRSRSRPFSVRVRVGFVPKTKGAPNSTAFTNVTFR